MGSKLCRIYKPKSKEKTVMMEGGLLQEETSFKEFEESMEHTKTMYKGEVKSLKAEQAYKKKIEAYKVLLYGDLKSCKKADDIVRLISINVNCLSMQKQYNYKVKQLRWVMHKYKVDSMGLQEVGVN